MTELDDENFTQVVGTGTMILDSLQISGCMIEKNMMI